MIINDDIRREVEYERGKMERRICEIENRKLPRPKDPDIKEALISGLKVFGVSIAIAATSFLLAVATDGAYIFELIAAAASVFGTIIAICFTCTSYNDERRALEKWKNDMDPEHQQAEIAKIKERYEARIDNLQRYGKIQNPYKPQKIICKWCDSEDTIRITTYNWKIVQCKDCGKEIVRLPIPNRRNWRNYL